MKKRNANERPTRPLSRRKPGKRRQVRGGRKVQFLQLLAKIISRRRRDAG